MKLKNAVLSAWFGTMQLTLTLIFGLIVPRMFIMTFGSEVNGMLASIGNLYSYLALVEAGVGTVAIQALYGPVGRKNEEEINGIMSATANWYNKAGIAYFIGAVLISVLYPITVRTEIDFWTIFWVSILSGMGGVINFLVQGKYIVLFRAEGKNYIMSIVTMVIYVSQNIAKITMLLMGFNVIQIHVMYFVISLLQMLFYVIYINKYYRWVNLKAPMNKLALKQSNSVLLQQLTWMICSNTDIIVLTYVAMDLKSVSVYTVYFMIFVAVERLYSTLFGSFHYILGQEYNNNREHYDEMHKKYETLSMAGAFVLYTIAFLLTTPFMKVYTAGITDIQYVDFWLPILFTAMELLKSSREASSRVINFAMHFKQMNWRTILEAGINVVASVVLVLYLGIYGVLLGTIIAYLWRTNDIIIYANRKILHRSCWETYRLWITNLATFGVICLIAHFIDLTVGSIWMFFIMAVPVGIAVVVIYYVQLKIFNKETAKLVDDTLKKRFRSLIGRFGGRYS